MFINEDPQTMKVFRYIAKLDAFVVPIRAGTPRCPRD